MSDHWKMEADIEYCVPCGYANLAAYMAAELFQAAGPALAISLTPGHSGAFKVTVDGEVLWDKQVRAGQVRVASHHGSRLC